MSDRTCMTAQVSFNRTPTDAEYQKIVALLDEHGWSGFFSTDPDADIHENTVVGQTDEQVLGSGSELGEALHKAFPEAIVTVWEDPKYEYMGVLYRYSGADYFEGTCDADGNVCITDSELQQWIKETSTREQLVTKILVAIGEAHELKESA